MPTTISRPTKLNGYSRFFLFLYTKLPPLSIPVIETSRAQKVIVNINNYDQIPLQLTYNDVTNPNAPVAIDIRPYTFSFDLLSSTVPEPVQNYTLLPNGSSAFLRITGTGNNIIDMSAMWRDIQQNQLTLKGTAYRLVQLVTDNAGNSFVHVIYSINEQPD